MFKSKILVNVMHDILLDPASTATKIIAEEQIEKFVFRPNIQGKKQYCLNVNFPECDNYLIFVRS